MSEIYTLKKGVMLKTKLFGMLLIFVLIFEFSFSIMAYAGDDIERSGDILQILLPVAASSIALYKGDQDGIIQFSKSLLTTLGTTYALKYSINETRPNGGSHSFPSVHASAAFSGASFYRGDMDGGMAFRHILRRPLSAGVVSNPMNIIYRMSWAELP
ncbi:hypothetical protein [Desulfobacula sp.]